MVPVISVIGSSKTGKTMVLQEIIKHIEEKGYNTGVIKHSRTFFDFKDKEKDTDRLWSAGARKVVFSGPYEFVIQQRVSKEYSLEEIISLIDDNLDVIFTEGYKGKEYPKIEIFEQDKNNNISAPGYKIEVLNKGDINSAKLKELADQIISDFIT